MTWSPPSLGRQRHVVVRQRRQKSSLCSERRSLRSPEARGRCCCSLVLRVLNPERVGADTEMMALVALQRVLQSKWGEAAARCVPCVASLRGVQSAKEPLKSSSSAAALSRKHSYRHTGASHHVVRILRGTYVSRRAFPVCASAGASFGLSWWWMRLKRVLHL